MDPSDDYTCSVIFPPNDRHLKCPGCMRGCVIGCSSTQIFESSSSSSSSIYCKIDDAECPICLNKFTYDIDDPDASKYTKYCLIVINNDGKLTVQPCNCKLHHSKAMHPYCYKRWIETFSLTNSETIDFIKNFQRENKNKLQQFGNIYTNESDNHPIKKFKEFRGFKIPPNYMEKSIVMNLLASYEEYHDDRGCDWCRKQVNIISTFRPKFEEMLSKSKKRYDSNFYTCDNANCIYNMLMANISGNIPIIKLHPILNPENCERMRRKVNKHLDDPFAEYINIQRRINDLNRQKDDVKMDIFIARVKIGFIRYKNPMRYEMIISLFEIPIFDYKVRMKFLKCDYPSLYNYLLQIQPQLQFQKYLNFIDINIADIKMFEHIFNRENRKNRGIIEYDIEESISSIEKDIIKLRELYDKELDLSIKENAELHDAQDITKEYMRKHKIPADYNV